MSTIHLIPLERLRAAIGDLLKGFGSDAREVELVADNLLQANLTGHDSHGVGMLPRYASAFLEGGLRPNAHVAIRLDSGTLLALDGQAGFAAASSRWPTRTICAASAPGPRWRWRKDWSRCTSPT
jgi:uncharacterized oxidoreductase